MPSAEALRINEDAARQLRLFSLDSNDNCLIGLAHGYTSRVEWDAINRVYLGHVRQLILSRLMSTGSFRVVPFAPDTYPRDVTSGAVVLALDWNAWTIRQVETYWEYFDENAIGRVHDLYGPLQEVSSNVEQRDTYPGEGESSVNSSSARRTTGNAPIIEVGLGNAAVRLIIYAKAMERVRLEVRHLQNFRSIYGRRATHRELPSTFDGLVDALRFVNEEARGRLNRILNLLFGAERRSEVQVHDLIDFLSELATSTSDRARMQTVLTELVMHGRIELHGDGSEQTALEALAESGVVERVRPLRRSRYRLYRATERFEPILRHLRALIQRATA